MLPTSVPLFRISAFLVCLLAAGGSRAQQVVQIPDGEMNIRWDDHFDILIDSAGRLDFADIQTSAVQAKFQPNTRKSLAFGYTRHTIWLRAALGAPRGNEGEWLMEIPAPFLEYVDFHQQVGGQWQAIRAGYYRPHASRGIPHTGFAWPLRFDSLGQSTVYIRIAGHSPKTFPVYVVERNTFFYKNRAEDLGYGIFFGVMGVMFFFNLVIGVSLRQRNYLLYVGTIFCSFFIFSTASGYTGKYLWPLVPEMNFFAGRMIMALFVITLALFAVSFLETRKYARWLHYSLLAQIPLALVAAGLVAAGVMPSALNSLMSVTAVTLIAAGVVCRLRGNRVAGYFIGAWTVYLVGGLVLLQRNAGVFEFNFWTTHLPEIGAALETIIIAFALADQYRIMKEEKEQAQQLALRAQQEANEKLEQMVADRTKELSSTVDELNQLLEENVQKTEVIRQKNEELDAFFYGVSHDLKSPIASLQSLTALARLEVTDPAAQDYFGMQEREMNRLGTIVSDLISITRFDHQAVHRDWIDFNKMTDDCLQGLRSLPNYDRVNFIREIAPGIRFQSEWTFVNNILQNLVENAVKYAAPANARVKIRIEPHGTGVLMEVADNGIGIAPEHIKKIFDMFYRATDESTGTGLGLFILKRSVNRLGGTIRVESEPGRGSTFVVQLP